MVDLVGGSGPSVGMAPLFGDPMDNEVVSDFGSGDIGEVAMGAVSNTGAGLDGDEAETSGVESASTSELTHIVCDKLMLTTKLSRA